MRRSGLFFVAMSNVLFIEQFIKVITYFMSFVRQKTNMTLASYRYGINLQLKSNVAVIVTIFTWGDFFLRPNCVCLQWGEII